MEHKGIFHHKCVIPGCERVIEYDDEPWCFEHSPDEGSSLRGYSARRAAQLDQVEAVKHNIFQKEE